MIVLDASAALSALLNAGSARQAAAAEQVHAPHLIDAEVANGLRRRVAAGHMTSDAGWVTLETWTGMALTRYPIFALMDRVWSLRDNVSSYDASYVALAEALDCALVTADARLARAPGLRCSLTVVPR